MEKVYDKRCENIIKRINNLKITSKELENKNGELQKENDILRENIKKSNYQLAIKENKVHYLNNKLANISFEYEERIKEINSNEDEICNEDNTTYFLEHIKELEYIKSTNMYKIWTIYRKLPEGIRSFNRTLLIPFKWIFKLLKKLK